MNGSVADHYLTSELEDLQVVEKNRIKKLKPKLLKKANLEDIHYTFNSFPQVLNFK